MFVKFNIRYLYHAFLASICTFFTYIILHSVVSFYGGGFYSALLDTPTRINTIILFCMYVFFLLIFLKSKKTIILSIISGNLIVIGLSIYTSLFVLKSSYADIPKIYTINPARGIQAQMVTIRGIHFTPPARRGKVMLGKEEMIIHSWTEKEIVAEQPVLTQKGAVSLFVVRSDDKTSNSFVYEIRDPSTLKK